MRGYVKRRGLAEPGSIAEALDIFRMEVRFYEQIAPIAGIRVPACYHAGITDRGTVLVLEDLSEWQAGAEPETAARVLSDLHRRWVDRAHHRWPWLRPVGAAAHLVDELFRRTWPYLVGRPDLTVAVRGLVDQLPGRVAQADLAAGATGPPTLVHGDASLLNMRTGPDREVVLLDWEDVAAAPGVIDLAWLLVSSVEPTRWRDVIEEYGSDDGLIDVLPAVLVQALLSLSDTPAGSPEALAWITRIEAAALQLTTHR